MPCGNFRKESYVRNGYRIVWDNICKSFLVDPCSFPSFFLDNKRSKKENITAENKKK
jgi:catalase